MSNNPETLGRYREILRYLQKSLDKGFALRTSPVPTLLETIIDIILELKLSLKEESFGSKNNKELIFLDFEAPDELGNSRQRKQAVKPDFSWFDPESGKYLDQIVSFFILMKKHKSAAVSFMETFSKQAEPISHKVKTEDKVSKSRKKESRKNSNSRGYWQRRKRSRSKRSKSPE